MTKNNTNPLLNKFLSLLILLLHLGCFLITTKSHRKPKNTTQKPKISYFSSPWSYLKRKLSFQARISETRNQTVLITTPTTFHSTTSSQQISTPPPEIKSPVSNPTEKPSISSDLLLPLRNNIYPCTICGEIFLKSYLLGKHRAIQHAVSELTDSDSGKNIVNIIFKSGWPDLNIKSPEIIRVLKIHSSDHILTRFEEHREFVKVKSARNKEDRDERCIADGNELLRFHCSTFTCELGQNGNSALCNHQYCSICGIIKSGFSRKLDGISTSASGWRAHMAVPEDIEEEFKFMNVKRAMLVCRVVAGRIGLEASVDSDYHDDDNNIKEGGFDSVVGSGCGGGGGEIHGRIDEEELVVFNPTAVLPCFVIVYTV